jgi:hypothetical protein
VNEAVNDPTGADEPAPCPQEEQAVAWALHALEPDEEEQMRAHIPNCRSCQNTIRETEAVMGGLAASIDQVDPPPRLRAGILAEAAATPQVPADRAAAPEPAPAAALPPSPPRRVGPHRPERRRFSVRRLVAAAAVVVALVGIGGLASYTVQVQQQRDAQIARTQALADLVVQLTQPGSQLAILSTGEGQAVAAVLVTPSDRVVVTSGIPANDHSATVYVVWGLGTGAPVPLGAFDVMASGPGIHDLGPATGPSPFSSYAVSIEPGRTVPPVPSTVMASGAVQT